MALVIIEEWFPYKDRTAIAVNDATQEHVDGDDGGWSVGSNPARADRCLVFWTKYISSESIESYLTQQTSTQNTDKTVAFAPGLGLADTDKSRFTVDYTVDGHLIFYMLPIVQAASEPSGVQGDLYFNTTDIIVYYHDGSSFVALDTEHLPDIEATTGIAVEEYLFDLNKRVCLATKTRTLLYDTPREPKTLKEGIRELRNKDLMWWSTFKEGKQPTARKLLKSVEDVC